MKLIRLSGLLLLSLSASAFAAYDGFYVDGNLGWTNAAYSTSDFNYMTGSHIVSSGFGGGIDFGYQFTRNWAAQVGYTRAARTEVSNISMASNTPGGITSLLNGSIATNIWDLALKGMLPLKQGFGVFAKAGVAYVNANVGGGLDQSNLGSMYQDNSQVLPEAGFGVSYDWNDNITTAISYTQVFKGGNIPNIQMAMLNLGYHFG